MLEINYLLILIFSSLAGVLLVTLFFQRIIKNLREKRKILVQSSFIEFVNMYMFEDTFDRKKGLSDFKKGYLIEPFDKKICLEQFLELNENVKGETVASIDDLFDQFGFCGYLLDDLKVKAWYRKARALYVLNKLNIQVPEHLVKPLINAKRQEVRHQAMLYLLNMSKEEPLSFLNDLNKPLSLWQQISLEDALKSYPEEIPDFSQWLNHSQQSVIIFCIKMIVDHNQFEHVAYLQNLVNHPNAYVRLQAIISLTKMEVSEVLPLLLENFPQENLKIKLQILNTIYALGSEEELLAVLPYIQQTDKALQMQYLKVERQFKPKKVTNKKEFAELPQIIKDTTSLSIIPQNSTLDY